MKDYQTITLCPPPRADLSRSHFLSFMPESLEDIKAGPTLSDNATTHPYRIHDRQGRLHVRCATLALACYRFRLDLACRYLYDDARNGLVLIRADSEADYSAAPMQLFADALRPILRRYRDGKSDDERLSAWLLAHCFDDEYTGTPGNFSTPRVYMLWP